MAEALGLNIMLTAETARLRASMNEANSILKGFAREAGTVSNTVSKLFQIGAAVGSVYAIKQFVGALGEMAARGDAIADVAESFKALGGNVANISAAKTAIVGLATSTDLMKVANQGLMAGIPGFEEHLKDIAVLGTQVGQALQVSTAEGIAKVTEAITSGKAKALEAVNIFVDGKDKAERQAQALEQLANAQKRLAPITVGAAETYESLNVQWKEFTENIEVAISNSDALKALFSGMAEGLKAINGILPDVLLGLDILFGSGANRQKYILADQLDDAKKKIAEIDNELANRKYVSKFDNLINGDITDPNYRKGLEDKRAQLTAEVEGIKSTQRAIEEKSKVEIKANKAAEQGSLKPRRQSEERSTAIRDEANKVEQLRQKWAEFVDKSNVNSLETGIKNAIEGLDRVSFENLQKKLADAVKKGVIDQWKEAIDSKAVSLDKVTVEAEKAAASFIADSSKQWSDSAEKNAKKVGEELKKAYKDSVDFWRNSFENAITGETFNFKDQGKQFGIGFLAEMITALGGGAPSGVSSVKDLGGYLAQQMQGTMGSLFGGMSAQEAAAQGLQGPSLANGMYSETATNSISQGIAAGLAVAPQMIQSILDAKGLDKANKDNRGTGSAVGGGLGAGIGYALGGPIGAQIGQQLGSAVGGEIGKLFKWGSQNPDTNARHAFANFIEDGFAKLKSIAFFDMQTGKLKLSEGNQLNFVEGARSRFNDGRWADALNNSPGANVFGGIATAMKELLGITEDVSGQMAFLLMENLGGSVDNARLLVYQLGLDFEELQDKLVEAGKKGSMTWLEVESSIQGLTEAFKPGLVALGDVKGAYDELLESGGRGMAALKGIKDIAQETLDKGGKTIEDIKARLLEAGVSPEEANAIYESIKQRGVKTIDELLSASDRTAGAIIADINAKSQTIAAEWEKTNTSFENQNKQLQEMKTNMESLPSEINSAVKINFTSTLDSNTQKVVDATLSKQIGLDTSVTKNALGGIVTSPTYFMAGNGLNVAGEAGPEAILPLERVNGKLGVRASGSSMRGMNAAGQSFIININATGAAAGVEHEVRRAVEDSKWSIIEKVMEVMDSEKGRSW